MKLTIELVPKTAWFNNLRSHLTQKEWDIVRRKCYGKAGHVCEVCGGKGPKHPVEAHEVWDFGDGIIKLTGLVALCPACHQVKHAGLAGLRGKSEEVISQLMKVNNITRDGAIAMLKSAFQMYHERSKRAEWEKDFSYLHEYLKD